MKANPPINATPMIAMIFSKLVVVVAPLLGGKARPGPAAAGLEA